MKRLKLPHLLSIMLLAVVFAACRQAPPAPAVTSVAINEGDQTITVGETVQLSVTVDAVGGADESVTWSSSNEAVATVNENGVVTGVAQGTADITATSVFDATKSDSVTITVVTNQPLTVNFFGLGSGRVTSEPASLDCRSDDVEPCEAAFAFGTGVTLTAEADPGSEFVRWEGDCEGTTCTLTMNEAKNVTAVFAQDNTTEATVILGSGDMTNWVDDAEEFIDGASGAPAEYQVEGATWTRNNRNRLGYDDEWETPVLTGLRFRNVTIPPGAIIESAYIQFTARDSHSDPISLTIHGQADANAGNFVDRRHMDAVEGTNNISSRARTSASVAWSDIPAWTADESGTAQRTPDLSDIVAEIVGLDGWGLGNSMVFIFSGDVTSTATRSAYAERLSGSTPSSEAVRPTLVITYR